MQRKKGDILVVDDEVAIVQFVIETLEDEGYSARPAYSGVQALAALDEAIPDLVLLDWLMPGISGNALLAHLQARGREKVPVVVMTADTQAAQALSAQGFPHCLIKPFTLEQLLECVARYIQTNGNGQQSSAA